VGVGKADVAEEEDIGGVDGEVGGIAEANVGGSLKWRLEVEVGSDLNAEGWHGMGVDAVVTAEK
jgi:hypothetical protein